MFGRFFDESSFEGILEPHLAKTVAKRVDELLGSRCQVVYGSAFRDESSEGWSTDKRDTDTHVALLLGAAPMAAFSKRDVYIQTDPMKTSDMVKAQAEQIRMLQHELQQARRIERG